MKNESGIHLLILRIASGDLDAQAELSDCIRPPLDRYIARRFGSIFSEEDVEDIVDQVILTMFLHAGEYRGNYGDPSAWQWAYRIAQNQTIKWKKSRHRIVHYPDSDPPGGPGGEEERMTLAAIQRNLDLDYSSVEDKVIESNFQEQVMAFVRQLSYRERLILFLRFEMRWTLDQIAKFIHVKPPRVHQILQNIFKKCRYAFD